MWINYGFDDTQTIFTQAPKNLMAMTETQHQKMDKSKPIDGNISEEVQECPTRPHPMTILGHNN